MRSFVMIACTSFLLGSLSLTTPAQVASPGKTTEVKPLSLPVHHISISVHDIDLMEKWYREKLGFTLDREMKPGGTAMVWLNSPNLSIHLAHGDGSSRQVPPGDSVADTIKNEGLNALVFTVSDLTDAYQTLKARGVVFIGPPPQSGTAAGAGNIRLAYFRDPEGNLLGIAQDVPPKN